MGMQVGVVAMPVIPATGEAEAGGALEPGVMGQSGSHSETFKKENILNWIPSTTKTTQVCVCVCVCVCA
jgi:hypothetical protein